MPKLNITHLPERLSRRIEQLENGEALEARDINALLTTEQQQELKEAWAIQQELRKVHKPPKTEEAKKQLGWKTIRDVRLDVYRKALQEALGGQLDGLLELQKKSEIRAARVFMGAFSKAHTAGENAHSAGRIALTQAGFGKVHIQLSKRDREVTELEDMLLKQIEDGLSDEDREQLEIVREHEKTVRK